MDAARAPACTTCDEVSARAPKEGATMRVLLIEDLDALGADVGDARERAARLKAAGARVTWVAVARHGATISTAEQAQKGGHLVARAESGPLLRSLLSSQSWESVLLASAWRGGGPLTRWLPRTTRWWPTGTPGRAEPHAWGGWARRARGERRLEALDGVEAGGPAWGLGWSHVEAAASRRPGLPLWDGDLMLSIDGLALPHGHSTIAAFAHLAETWSGLDLVGWSHPTDDVERRARALGVEMRIHQVGPPPRLAESSWLAQASASLVTGSPRISSGLVLRVLAAGCPLLWVEPERAAGDLARWLVERGCIEVAPSDPAAIAAVVERLIERGDDVERMIDRGKALAAAHDRHALTERLSAWFGAPPIPRAA